MTSPFPRRQDLRRQEAAKAAVAAAAVEPPTAEPPTPEPPATGLAATGLAARAKPTSEKTTPSAATVKPGSRRELHAGSATNVLLPWWMAHWQPLIIAFVVGVIGLAALLVARQEHERTALPVLDVARHLDNVSVEGGLGAVPVVSLLDEINPAGVVMREETFGEGRIVEEGTPVLLAISAFDGVTGANLEPDGAPSILVGTAGSETFGDTLNEVIIGATEGSRYVVARRLSSGHIEVDVVDILYTIAQGETVAGEGPAAVGVDGGGLYVAERGSSEPEEIVTQVLIEGRGPQVHEGERVVAQYLAVNWSDGTTVTSTWDGGAPRLIDLEGAMEGLSEALVDHRVGSRLLISLPAEKASGEDAMVVVVDILAASKAR